MPSQTIAKKVEALESRVSTLEELPGRLSAVETQIVQLRREMHDEFSALRQEMRGEMRAGDEETRRYMRVLHEDVIARLATIQEGLSREPDDSQ